MAFVNLGLYPWQTLCQCWVDAGDVGPALNQHLPSVCWALGSHQPGGGVAEIGLLEDNLQRGLDRGPRCGQKSISKIYLFLAGFIVNYEDNTRAARAREATRGVMMPCGGQGCLAGGNTGCKGLPGLNVRLGSL